METFETMANEVSENWKVSHKRIIMIVSSNKYWINPPIES